MNPSHEALMLVGDLLAHIHSTPTAMLAVRSSPAFTDLYDRARGIAIVANAHETSMRPVAAEVGWCAPCRAFHAKDVIEAKRYPIQVPLGGGKP